MQEYIEVVREEATNLTEKKVVQPHWPNERKFKIKRFLLSGVLYVGV